MSDRCAVCGEPLAADTRWCLQCGTAARTRIAAAPRVRLGAIVALVLIAAVAIALLSLGSSASAPPANGASGASGVSAAR